MIAKEVLDRIKENDERYDALIAKADSLSKSLGNQGGEGSQGGEGNQGGNEPPEVDPMDEPLSDNYKKRHGIRDEDEDEALDNAFRIHSGEPIKTIGDALDKAFGCDCRNLNEDEKLDRAFCVDGDSDNAYRTRSTFGFFTR